MAKRTFAQEAKAITNKYKLRLGEKFDKGDALALAAMNAELEALQAKQEAVRTKELPQPTQQFAKGGRLPMYFDGGKFDLNQSQYTNPTFLPGMGGYQQGVAPKLTTPDMATNFGTGINFNTGEGYFNPTLNTTNDGILPTEAGDSIPGFKSRVPWMGAAAGAIGGLLANRKIDLPKYEYEEWNPTQARANLVDYSRGREQTLRERDQANAMITRNARGTGSQAGLMENILAGATGTQRAAGDAFNRSLEQEGNVNAQIKNQVSQFNAGQDADAARINMQNKLYANQLDREGTLINEQRRSNQIGSITDSISGYMGDRMSANTYDQMVNMEMARNPNFNITQADPTFWRRLAGITDDASVTFRNTNDRALKI